MSKGKKISKCSDCGGKLHKLGTIGRISYSRCESCGKEQTKKLKKASLDKAVSANALRECITCSAKYAAAGDPDLCPECHASFIGRTAAGATKTRPRMIEPGLPGEPLKRETYMPDVDPTRELPMTVPNFEELPPAPSEPSREPEKVPAGVETEQLPISNIEITRPGEEPKRETYQPDVDPTREVPLTLPDFETLPEPPADPAETPSETPVEDPEKVPVGVRFDVFPITLKGEKPVKEYFAPSKVPQDMQGMSVAASANAHPNGELINLIQQQREDTSRWQNGENHSPNPNVDPSLLRADSNVPSVERDSETSVESGPSVESTVVAKVFSNSMDDINGAKVLLADGEFHVVGKVTLEAEDGFAVEWRSGRNSIEKKANYELVVTAAGETGGFDERHGGPFDRGAADSYYRRPFSPHYYVGPTAQSERVEITDEASEEYKAYLAGWKENERFGDFKDYGSDHD